MQVEGVIKIIGQEQTFGSNGFRKRELVVTTADQYPQHISIDFTQDKCNLLNSYKVGQDVKISINLGGREWISPEGDVKYFNSITGWRIESFSNNQTQPQQQAQPQNTTSIVDDGDDPLPF